MAARNYGTACRHTKLLKAADAIPSSSAGCLTVRYYALRLMIASGKSDAARGELDRLLNRKESDLPLGSRNPLNEERLKLTTSLEDLVQHAPETPVPSEVDFNTGEEVPADSKEDQPGQVTVRKEFRKPSGLKWQDRSRSRVIYRVRRRLHGVAFAL
jgi:hypothetical protein